MRKLLLILAGIAAAVGIAIGGWKVKEQAEYKQMVDIVKSEEAQKEYKALLKNLDSQAFRDDGIIQSYEIDDESVEYNPMGGILVTLYINNDEKLNVTYNLNKDISTGEYLPGSSSISEKLSQLLKENG